MPGILLNAILPIFVVASLGVLVGRWFNPDPRPISQLALYVFSPALIFSSLSTADIPLKDILSIFGFLVLWTPAMYIVSRLIAWQFGFRAKSQNAFLLSTIFMNAVNYGLPVAFFGFGEEGLDRALLFLAPMAIMSGTFAIWVASNGTSGSGLRGFLPLLRIPTFYATLGALAINPLNLQFPTFVANPLNLLGDAAIPTMLIVLGLQLTRASIRAELFPASVATIVRLLISPALAYGCTLILGMDGVTQQIVIVLSGMPTAVYTIILATEFDSRPNQVTSAVALTTVCSLFTLTSLLWMVQHWL